MLPAWRSLTLTVVYAAALPRTGDERGRRFIILWPAEERTTATIDLCQHRSVACHNSLRLTSLPTTSTHCRGDYRHPFIENRMRQLRVLVGCDLTRKFRTIVPLVSCDV